MIDKIYPKNKEQNNSLKNFKKFCKVKGRLTNLNLSLSCKNIHNFLKVMNQNKFMSLRFKFKHMKLRKKLIE